jgi:hypothetical protein
MPKLSELVAQPQAAPRRKLSEVQAAPTPAVPKRERIEAGGSPSLMARAARNLGGEPLEEGIIGLGRSLDRTFRGAKQLATDSLGNQSRLAALALRSAGMDSASNALVRNVSAPLAASSQRQRSEEAASRALESQYDPGGYVAAGDVLGTIGQIVGPGALLRGTSAAPAFLPRTIGGNMLQGSVLGAMQPVAKDGERGRNALVGTVASGAGAAVPRAAGAAIGAGRAVVAPFTQSGQNRIAAQVIRRSAVDPARLAASAPSPIPGVQRTLAEETLDPGIAQLQRQFPVQLADQQMANNAARVQAVRQTFRGADQASIDGIESARDAAADRAVGGLAGIANSLPEANPFAGLGVRQTTQSVIDLDPVSRTLGNLIDTQRGRPAVQSTLAYVRDLVKQPVRNAEEAYNVRKTIGDLMEGRIGGELASSKVARAQLMQAREVLDQQMAKAFPGWGAYLQEYRAASTAADQARVGQRFIEGSGVPRGVDQTTGEVMLTPAALMAGRNADRLTQVATGFPRATAETTLTPPQRNLLAQLADEADRIRFTQNAGRAAGSNTAQNLATGNVLQTLSGGNRLANTLLASQPAQRVAGLAERTYGLFGVPERLQSVLADALANPQQAREILAALPASDRSLVTQALARVGGTTGALTPALTE